jgi:serine/threonine-protein kinase
MDHVDGEQHLLFGLVALQHGLIDPDGLVAAFRAWRADRSRPIAQYLIERGDIDEGDRAAIEELVARQAETDGGDAAKSLADVSADRSTHQSLTGVGPIELEPTVVRAQSFATEACEQSDGTAACSVGAGRSEGERFRILRHHARGGLGAVFVALDRELNREVALKQLLDHHADAATSRQRFLLEAEITGGLEHPGIVPVYGLGTYPDGRPYYAMRFIRGESLKDAIERFHSGRTSRRDASLHSLELRKLLLRFLEVCNAIEYAHTRGVLHRDVKPGNIIVGKHGETLVVDWGLAKARGRPDASEQLDERPLVPSASSSTVETIPGTAFGTPAYMSPEQARGDLEHLGPRSDVYSLGATLYCLLTGRAPFDDNDVAAVLSAVQDGRFARPRLIDSTIDRALEAVCLKAMATRTEDRYATPRELADDIERWMADEPVSACHDPITVRLVRWARKHRTPVTTAAAVLVVAVLAAALVASQQTAYATDIKRKNTELSNANVALDLERKKAEEREELAVNALKRFGDAVSKNPVLKGNRELGSLRKELLKEPLSFLKVLRDQLQSDPESQPYALGRLASAAFDLAMLTEEIGDKQDALRAFEEALAIWQRLARKSPTVATVQSRLAKAYHNIGLLQHGLGHSEQALASFGRALQIQERLAQGNPRVNEYQSDLGKHHHSIGVVQSATGHPEEALASYRRALEIRQRLARDNPSVAEYQSDLAKTHHNIGGIQYETGHPEEALASLGRALEIHERLARETPTVTEYQSDLAKHHGNIAVLQHETGHSDLALASYGRALEIQERLARDYPSVTEYQRDLAMSHSSIAYLESQLVHPEQARPSYARALEIFERLVRENPTVTEYQADLAECHGNLGLLEHDTGHPDRALASHRAALAILDRLAREHPESPEFASALGGTFNNLAMIDLGQKRYADARTNLEAAIAWQKKALASYPKHPQYRRFLENHLRMLIEAYDGLNDRGAAAGARRALDELKASDPR